MEVISFEEKIKKAKVILEELANPEISLKEAMRKYKEGVGLLKEAQKILEEAKLEYIELKKEL